MKGLKSFLFQVSGFKFEEFQGFEEFLVSSFMFEGFEGFEGFEEFLVSSFMFKGFSCAELASLG